MKIKEFRVINDNQTNKDKDWSKRLEKVLFEIKYLKEEMIFTFKIED